MVDNVLEQVTKQEKIQHRRGYINASQTYFYYGRATVNSALASQIVFLWWLQMRFLSVMLIKVRLQKDLPIFYHYDWKLDQVTNYPSEMMKHPP